MASKKTAQKTVKEVTFIARIEFKCDHRKVVYLVRSSNGVDQYETSMFDGKATGCTCPSRKPCKHMKGAEQKEAARPFAAKRLPEWTTKLVETGKLQAPVKPAKTEKVESSTIQPIESKDLATKGNLNSAPTSAKMPAWLAVLPSRQQALAS